MRVKLLRDIEVDIEETPREAFGLLLTRNRLDGSVQYYFPTGARPNVADAFAAMLLSAGLAEVCADEFPVIVSREQMLEDVATQ